MTLGRKSWSSGASNTDRHRFVGRRAAVLISVVEWDEAVGFRVIGSDGAARDVVADCRELELARGPVGQRRFDPDKVAVMEALCSEVAIVHEQYVPATEHP